MSKNNADFTIGSLAKATGVNVETIRFYQRKGLVAEPDRMHGAIRRYTDSDLARLQFIKSAQRIGFSLDEIAELLKLDDGTHCVEARDLAAQKLRDVRQRIADLRGIEAALDQLVLSCGQATGSVKCPLIESLHHQPRSTGTRA
ncbi:Hg(II)-responsive transcriptional regulator [Pseudoduganella eburnea]|uniref:Mercuric resistance operon regulatory protein n=1 Tax=Massilia eburnea TaxID=1776165 RepID=A0A6L6QEM1_9BURK|nr:Hg(II)-responsive transcriptional regulator [Massilia eburnea]MTW10601.1 Hg(II)-responsive transcriptional regulator [Massilia eburnea]